MLNKRSQVTIFVILGILIVVVLALVFYLYGERLKVETKEETKFDISQVEPLKLFVEDCIEQSGEKALDLVGKQGGEIDPGFYQNWNCRKPGDCDKVSYLCYTTEYASCYNKKPFLNNFIQQEINSYITRELNNCIDLQKIRDAGFNVQAGSLKVSTLIGDYSTIVNVDYPITLTKGNTILKQDKFSKKFDAPLGRLIIVAQDVVDMEINGPQGVAFYEGYLIRQNGKIQLERHTYKDTEIYIAKTRDNPYKFQFAIQNYVVPFP